MSGVEIPDIATIRVDYEAEGIDPDSMADDPFEEFMEWFAEAVKAGVNQPNTFMLATSTPEGSPSVRAILMKDLGPEGLTFYTNTASRKGQELGANPRAAGCFVWIDLHRQIRFEGWVTPVEEGKADAYFATRPPGARLAAASSHQSQVVPSRASLDERYQQLAERYPDGDVPRPTEWGGYTVAIDNFEFWQGRPDRFHDRVRYRLVEGGWEKERLSP